MNKYQLIPSLKPHQALQVLNGGLSSLPGKSLAQVEQIRLKIMAESGQPARVMLVVPEPTSDLARATRDAYTHLFPGGSVQLADDVKDTLDLRSGLATLLALPRQDEEPAPLAASDYLAVAGGNPERAARIFQRIAMFTTQVAVAALEQDQNKWPTFLFHVIADSGRDEAFTTLGNEQGDILVLQGYEVSRAPGGESWLVFAPPGRAPGRQTLASFLALTQLAGVQLGLPGQADGRTLRNRKLLAALLPPRDTPTNGGAPITLIYLRQQEFIGQDGIAAPVRPPSEARFLSLNDSAAALRDLRQAIDVSGKARGERVGYHLRLRSTRYVAEPHRDRDWLLEQKEQIEQKLEYLDSTELPRPKLLRFNEQQLPALADYVRSFPMRVLADEQAIRYAFQSTEVDGSGVHFLLIDPSRAPLVEMDPLPRWERVGDPTIRFWLDPFWARFYLGEGETLIYVPEGFYMTPTMHAATKREMDSYVRTVMDQWCRPEFGAPSIPQRPIYMFEPHPTIADHLVIAVLNYEQFVPLGKQLDWLNRHLHVRHARIKGHEILELNSDVLNDDDLIAQLEASRAEREQRLQRAATAAVAQVAQSSAQLSRLLTDDLRAVLDLSQKTLDALREAKERLAQLYIAKDQAVGLNQAADGAATQTRTLIAAVGKETETLRNEGQQHEARALAAHQYAEQQIEQLDQLYHQLRSRLDGR